MNLKKTLFLYTILSVAFTSQILNSYTIFNNSNEVISALAFKDEKSAQMFFHRMGWAGEVAKVADKVTTATIAAAPMFIAYTAGTSIGVKIAQAAIMSLIWHRHPTMYPPDEAREDIKILTDDLEEIINERKEDISYNYEYKIEKAKLPKRKEKLAEQRDKEIEKMIASENENVGLERLKYTSSSSWYWKDITRKHKKFPNPYIVIARIPSSSLSILGSDPFEKLQPGAKIADWEIVSAGYINRAGILVFEGNEKPWKAYLPFVPNSLAPQAKKGTVVKKSIKWKTLDQAKKENLKIYEAMTGCSLETVEQYYYNNDITQSKNFDHGLSLFFKNFSDHPVHAIFFQEKDLPKIFKAGGWTEKSIKALFDITNTLGPVIANAATAAITSGASATSPIQLGSLVPLTTEVTQKILGDLPQKAARGITIEAIKPRDYFKSVFPGNFRYSYFKDRIPGVGIKRARSAIKTGFSRIGNNDLIIAVFPSVKNRADLSAPEYIGNFDSKEFNGIYYWQEPGDVAFIKFDPVKGKTTNRFSTTAAVPIQRVGNGVELTEEGKEVVTKLLKKSKGKIKKDETLDLEDLLN